MKLKERMIMYYEQEGIEEETVMAYFTVIYKNDYFLYVRLRPEFGNVSRIEMKTRIISTRPIFLM
jgi:hypothetical protein